MSVRGEITAPIAVVNPLPKVRAVPASSPIERLVLTLLYVFLIPVVSVPLLGPVRFVSGFPGNCVRVDAS